MKYDDKFPYALTNDKELYDGCMIKAVIPSFCFVCGNLTQWVDIDYQGFICSEECQRRAAEDAAKC
jgi:hypothetical protein